METQQAERRDQDAIDWQHRYTKRASIVRRFKATTAYRCSDASCRGLTPDPTDRSLSNRAWNFQMFSWKHTLDARSDTSVAFPGNRNICTCLRGEWIDSQGAMQIISNSQNNAIQIVSTQSAARSENCSAGVSFVIVMLMGCAEPTWANHFTYRLERWNQNALVWNHIHSNQSVVWRRKAASTLSTASESTSSCAECIAAR